MKENTPSSVYILIAKPRDSRSVSTGPAPSAKRKRFNFYTIVYYFLMNESIFNIDM